ncbi:MAG: acyltransferase family protein [Pseudomonadota bacterium]
MAAHRIDWVDASKGICILLVVMFHATQHLVPKLGAGGVFDWITTFSGSFRMPDFFLISGLFLSTRLATPWRDFLDRKVVHFFYFYWLWMIITYVVLTPGLSQGWDVYLGAFARDMVIPNGVLWFIYILPICFVIARATAGVPPVLVWLGAAAAHTFDVAGEPLILVYVTHYFVFFYTGHIAAPLLFKLAERARKVPVLGMIGLACWALANGVIVFDRPFGFPGLSLILGVAGGAAIVVLTALLMKTPVGRGLGWLGARSIVVYLGFFIPLRYAEAVFLSFGLSADATIALSIMAAVALPLLLHAVLERARVPWLFERPGWARLPRRAPPQAHARP